MLPLPATLARRLSPSSYERLIRRGLDRALARNRHRRVVALADLKAVIFSDHHRGVGDGADDFRRCEAAYAAALGYYRESGHELWLLGDVEELWENSPEDVPGPYDEILRLERDFGPRLVRIFGNHDMAWRNRRTREKHLARFVDHAPVHESMSVVVTDPESEPVRLFLVHGHQGTLDSGTLIIVGFSRLAVRLFWATLQRAFKFASTSPATDALLRGKHDVAMRKWAEDHDERLMLIAGHTHRPVFPGTRPPDPAQELRDAQRAYDDAVSTGVGVAEARALRELRLVRALRAEPMPVASDRPCYFNTGCCSFGDGDVTGLELSEGKIRLVRWLDNHGEPKPQELEAADLRTLFGQLTGKPAYVTAGSSVSVTRGTGTPAAS